MSSLVYNGAKEALLNGGFDFASDDLKVALVTGAYTADIDADEFFADISNEVSGTGYSSGGKSLSNVSVGRDDANDRAYLDADDLTWTLATFTARAAVMYQNTGTPGTSRLLAYVDFDEDKISSGQDFTIEWHAEGILYLGG